MQTLAQPVRIVRRPVAVLAFLLGAVAPIATSGADPPPATNGDRELTRKVEGLIGGLDSVTLAARMRAERELIALGPQILPLLPPPELAPNVSVREAIRRVRVTLERRKARESVQSGRVTLEGTFPLAEILKRVSAQTGNAVDVSGLPERLQETPLRVEYRNRPFWSVLDDLAVRAKFRFRYDASAERLRLVPSPATTAPQRPAVDNSGPYRVSVESAGLRPLFGDDEHRLLRIRLRLFAEPRLRPLFLKYAAQEIVAETAAGRELAPFTPDASRELPFGEGGRELEFDVEFKVPRSVELDRVALRGNVTLHTAAGTERIGFDRLAEAAGIARRRGGVTVALQKAAFDETKDDHQRAHVRIAVSYDAGGPAFESHRTWIFHNRVYLETNEGRRIEPTGPFTTALQADGGVAVEYTFEDLKKGAGEYRFVYVAPTLLIDVPVEFGLKDVPVSSSAERKPQ